MNIPGEREKFDRNVRLGRTEIVRRSCCGCSFSDKLFSCAEAHRSARQLTSPSLGGNMPAPADYLISEDEERSLHRRLVDRDVTAFNDLARLFLDHLIAWLVENNRSSVPKQLCIDAAEDALIALVKLPASF